MNESTVVVQKGNNQNKLSWNNLFINQTNLLGKDLIQQGVPKKWFNRSNNIECHFQAQMKTVKVEAIKSTKNQRPELVQVYKEDKEWDALLNNDDTVYEEDDSGYESETWGEPQKNYKDDKYITNNELYCKKFSKKIQCEILVI